MNTNLVINTINFITKEEVEAMPTVNMEVTRNVISSHNTGVRRETFTGTLRFNKLASFRINLSSDEYALLNYFAGKNGYSDQFNVKAKVRFIETQWPANGDLKARSTYLVDVYVDEDLRWSFDLTHHKFLPVLKKNFEKGELQAYTPIVRAPGKREQDEAAEGASTPLDNAEKKDEIPF